MEFEDNPESYWRISSEYQDIRRFYLVIMPILLECGALINRPCERDAKGFWNTFSLEIYQDISSADIWKTDSMAASRFQCCDCAASISLPVLRRSGWKYSHFRLFPSVGHVSLFFILSYELYRGTAI